MDKTIKQLKYELERLEFSIRLHPKVLKAQEEVRKELQPKMDELKKQIEALRSERPKPKGRWPDNCPQEVIDAAKSYWKGTEQLHTFRIHCWNDKAYWTSWPSGGYWTVGGFVKSPATFFMISRTQKDQYDNKKGVTLSDKEGRVSLKEMQAALDKIKD